MDERGSNKEKIPMSMSSWSLKHQQRAQDSIRQVYCDLMLLNKSPSHDRVEISGEQEVITSWFRLFKNGDKLTLSLDARLNVALVTAIAPVLGKYPSVQLDNGFVWIEDGVCTVGINVFEKHRDYLSELVEQSKILASSEKSS